MENVDEIDKQPILLYYENETLSGGYGIAKHEYQNGNLIIYYKDENTVSKVLDFGGVNYRQKIYRAKIYTINSKYRI